MRRRFGFGLIVLCCASVGATPAVASDGGTWGGPGDFAVGSAENRLAEFTPFPFQLEVSAQRLATGEVTGHVRGYGEIPLGGEFWVEGEVTCLRVEPKPAAEVALTGVPGTRASI